ncbi:hypothetical protein [Alkaliphilus crotonatoxidans]
MTDVKKLRGFLQPGEHLGVLLYIELKAQPLLISKIDKEILYFINAVSFRKKGFL